MRPLRITILALGSRGDVQALVALGKGLRAAGYNGLTYRLSEQMAWQPFRRTVNRWRREVLGLSPAPFRGSFRRMYEESSPVLDGFSAHVVPRRRDWGDHIHVTGYWFLDEEDWHPPRELVELLEAGPPPMFIGFGSMPVGGPDELTRLALGALWMSGQRGILSAGWGGIGGRDLPESICSLGHVPYAWLLPRVRAVVHHGGSGTKAAALCAGVPSVVVPFVMDQFYWGRRIAALRVGPKPIPHRQLTAARLARAIHAAVSDAGLQRRAQDLGDAIRAERGVDCAVEAFHRHLEGTEMRIR